MKLRNGLLALLVAVMAALCVASVVRPMRFSQQRAERETVVKQRLKAIGEAQERYRKEKGTYCPTLRELVGGGFLADSLRMIPFADGKEFRLQVSAMENEGEPMTTMECGALLTDYLTGLDAQETERAARQAEEAGGYPGLRIGDLNRPNYYGGNWE